MATPATRLRKAKSIMRTELSEQGHACYCGEPYCKGKPCNQCQMAAFLLDMPATSLFINRHWDKKLRRCVKRVTWPNG